MTTTSSCWPKVWHCDIPLTDPRWPLLRQGAHRAQGRIREHHFPKTASAKGAAASGPEMTGNIREKLGSAVTRMTSLGSEIDLPAKIGYNVTMKTTHMKPASAGGPQPASELKCHAGQHDPTRRSRSMMQNPLRIRQHHVTVLNLALAEKRL